MRNEHPFRDGDRVIYNGKRRPELYKGPLVGEKLFRDAPAKGVVQRIWKKNSRNMVDVYFHHFGNYVVYDTELKFDVLDTLGAL